MTSSEGCTTHRYTLRFKAEALAEWNALDGSVRTPIKKLLAKRLDNPPVPGGVPHGPLAGCYKSNLLKHCVRLVYDSANVGRPSSASAKSAVAKRSSRREPGT